MISAHGRLVLCQMNTGEVLKGIWTRIDGAPKKQVIVTTVEMQGPPNSIEVQDDDGRWVDCRIAAVTAGPATAIAEMRAQEDVPISDPVVLMADVAADVTGASYVSVPLDPWAADGAVAFEEAKDE